MNIVELNNLEFQVDTLLSNLDKLQADNQSLRNQLTAVQRERNRLKEKNQRACVKINRIIAHLKESLS